ncbi:zona pellucida sperm-binding protein 4-like isoform X1 [Carassius carassius]|uniref:zona pellucida sperm-binding protein 4-like isoform X1 n=1 Tax=Carassius carassius TaxID=217509 RepID=UPI00286958A8|nr:zona pellucida sperm-binding protein 4-like isoform X1 [Carassius carassius]
MAWQGVKTVILVLCCIDLALSLGSEPVSTLDPFASIDDEYSGVEADYSEMATQGSVQVMKSKLAVYCNNDTMKTILLDGSSSQVQILGVSVIESVYGAPVSCGYSLTRGRGHNILVVDYADCPVVLEDGHYTLRIHYQGEDGQLDVATVSCDAKQSLTASLKHRSVQSEQIPVCAQVPPTQPYESSPPLSPSYPLLLNSKPRGCSISDNQRVSCGTSGITQDECLATGCCFDERSSVCYYPMDGCSISDNQRVSCGTSGITQDECLATGCCFDERTSVCYYPMDECTADKNFVFAVYNDFTNLPVNPMSLMVAGKTGCKPVISNKDFAIFKFSVSECGTRSFVIGETVIYLAEVQTIIKVRNLKYGVISRDNPIRLMVECRYPRVSAAPMFAGPVLASAGYMVMSPSLPPFLVSEGRFGVQLLISLDETFTKFYPQCHQPLHVLLGKSVYLELRLRSRKPAATLIVHYCVAYPRFAKSALILLFDGCPNPLDSGTTSILYMKHLPQNRHQRRFEVKAFQFMDLSTRKYLNEEIYFMCSTEVCLPSGSPCTETCFDGKFP